MGIKNKISEYYANLSLPVKASFWYVISSVIQKGISFITTPIFTRLIPAEQYGMLSVFSSWNSILGIVLTLNLSAGVYNNGITKWPEARASFTSSLQGLSTTVTLFFLAVYCIAIPFWNSVFKLSSFYMLAIFAEALFTSAFSFWAASQRYDYKYLKLVIVSISIGVCSPLIGIIAVSLTNYKVEARVFSFVLVQVLVGIVLYIRSFVLGRSFFSLKYWKYALAFNIPLIPHYLAQIILGSSDRIMISRMVGNKEAAIYDVAFVISSVTGLLTTAINNSFIPYTYKSLKNDNLEKLRSIASSLSVTIMIICAIAMCFGPEIIRVVAPIEYYDARWVIPPVAASMYFPFVRAFFANIEFFYEKTKFVMIASISAAIINIILNYIFIGIFGYIAAAYTTLVCYVILMLLHYMMYKTICKSKGLKGMYNDRLIFGLGLLLVLFMVFITCLYDIIILRYSLVVLALVIIIAKRKKIISIFQNLIMG